jgi:hypothetical protein
LSGVASFAHFGEHDVGHWSGMLDWSLFSSDAAGRVGQGDAANAGIVGHT